MQGPTAEGVASAATFARTTRPKPRDVEVPPSAPCGPGELDVEPAGRNPLCQSLSCRTRRRLQLPQNGAGSSALLGRRRLVGCALGDGDILQPLVAHLLVELCVLTLQGD